MIRLEDLRMTWRRRDGSSVPVLDIPLLEVESGEQRCLVGGSGSGKTTLLNIIAGIVVPTAGRVQHDDTDITTLSEVGRDRFRAAHVGYVFQTFNLLQGHTAVENVALSARLAGAGRTEAKARAVALLDRVLLSHRLDARPGEMSVGEQQRVAIARAVVNKPGLLLADEPTANLDEDTGEEVLGLLQEVARENGSTLLLVTHASTVMDRFDLVTPLKEISS